MSAGERCLAAHVEDVTSCGGPVRAVRIVDQAGAEVTGCVRHGAVLLASLEGGRVYPGPQARGGDAIEVFKRAQELSPFSFESADGELSSPVPVSEGSQVSGEGVGPAVERPNLAATGAGNGGVVPVPVAAQPRDSLIQYMRERGQGMICGRCDKPTGNNHQGHYWKHCTVTKQMEVFHFCCPGDCDRATAWRDEYEKLATRFSELGITVDDGNAYGVPPKDARWVSLLAAAKAMDDIDAAWGQAISPLVDHNPETPGTPSADPDTHAADVTRHPLGCGCTSCADIRRSVAS